MGQKMVPVDDGFAVSEKPANIMIVGQMIKFDSGIYKVNKTETLPPDIELVATHVTTAWVKWWGKRPVEHHITELGQQHLDRNDLPDQNKAEWEIGLDGQAVDPWKDTRYLGLIDPLTGADYTFVTDSIGGRRGISDLKSQIRNVRYAHPDAVPLVKLRTTTMKTRFGPRPRPLLEVSGWRRKNGPTEKPFGQNGGSSESSGEQLKIGKPQMDFNDPTGI
jgi:hypothetical protein